MSPTTKILSILVALGAGACLIGVVGVGVAVTVLSQPSEKKISKQIVADDPTSGDSRPKGDVAATKKNSASKATDDASEKARLALAKQKQEEAKRQADASLALAKQKQEEAAFEKWLVEVNREYAAALALRANQKDQDALRIGMLGNRAKRAVIYFQKVKAVGDDPANISKIDRLGSLVINEASNFDPRYVRAVQREHGLQILAKMGKSDASRLPWPERKKLHDDFAAMIGEPHRQWGLDVRFDDLNANEMNELIAALRQASAPDGFRSLTRHQRLLILDAGALEFFRRQAGIGPN